MRLCVNRTRLYRIAIYKELCINGRFCALLQGFNTTISLLGRLACPWWGRKNRPWSISTMPLPTQRRAVSVPVRYSFFVCDEWPFYSDRIEYHAVYVAVVFYPVRYAIPCIPWNAYSSTICKVLLPLYIWIYLSHAIYYRAGKPIRSGLQGCTVRREKMFVFPKNGKPPGSTTTHFLYVTRNIIYPPYPYIYHLS